MRIYCYANTASGWSGMGVPIAFDRSMFICDPNLATYVNKRTYGLT